MGEINQHQDMTGTNVLQRLAAHCLPQARAVIRLVERQLLAWPLAIACLTVPAGVQAAYSNLFLFGDSLSDSGNNAFVFDYVVGPPLPPGTLRTPLPTSGNTFIPDFPYSTPVGGRYSNGAVWAETFASSPHIGSGGALASNLGGTNYAYAGARVGPVVSNFPFSLSTQVAGFLASLAQNQTAAPADALYVVAGGGNDARDSISAAGQDMAAGKTQLEVLQGIQARAAVYAGYVEGMVDQLLLAGAHDIVVWNTPNAGVAPAILAQNAGVLGATVSQLMNLSLRQALDDELAAGVRIFDAFGFITGVSMAVRADPINNPYGLTDAANACSAIVGANCDDYFFWDGIHPTAAGHKLLAAAMASFVPEPDTLLLLAISFFGLAAARQRKSR